jgi:predicted HTH domain antitoxin
MDLLIKDEILKKAEITADELLIEIAVHLYDTERLSIGQAKTLAGLDLLSFQKELSNRNIYVKYDIEDIETDLQNLEYIRK